MAESFKDGQMTEDMFISHFIECLHQDDAGLRPQSNGYWAFLLNELSKLLNVEEYVKTEQYNSKQAVNMLKEHMAAVDITRVKLITLPPGFTQSSLVRLLHQHSVEVHGSAGLQRLEAEGQKSNGPS